MEKLFKFNKKFGDRHFIPKELPAMLEHVGVSKKQTNELVDKLFYVHTQDIHDIYIEILKMHNITKEAKK